MNRKRAISILAILLAVLMVLSLVLSVLPTAYAVTQGEIDALQQKREELAARAQEAKERLESMQEQEASVLQKKATLDEENRVALESLSLVAEQIAMYDQMVDEKTKELDAALDAENTQAMRYRARVRSMEENGGYNFLALIFNAGSFADLLAAFDDMDAIMESDKRLEEDYRAARQEVERVKAEYEQVRTECKEKQKQLREEQTRIEKQIEETNETLAALADEIAEAEAIYEQERDAEAAAAAEVTALIAEYEAQKRAEEEERRKKEEEERRRREEEEERRRREEGGDDPGDDPSVTPEPSPETPPPVSGSFIWPVPCSTRITGRYGESRPGHFHAGIDIDGYGNDGQPVVAAASGTVITSTYSDGYGNYVLIDHGNGYQTLYAHMSSNAVSSGSWVNAGATVGYLGATGNASGTHCHFEVRINGATTDPTQYFSGWYYY